VDSAARERKVSGAIAIFLRSEIDRAKATCSVIGHGATVCRPPQGMIDRARAACVGSDVDSSNHFVETTKMIRAGKGPADFIT